MENNIIEQWRNYAGEIRDIRNRLLKVTTNSKYQKLLPKKEQEYLVRALKLIDKFRDEAEEVMSKHTGSRDITIWYT